MDANPYTQQPQPLFGHSQHAGGWPKLGFAAADTSDEPAVDDED